MTIGVLALQGDFDLHRKALARIGHESVEVASNDRTRGRQVVAHGRHVVPPLDGDRGRHRLAQVATEGHDARGARGVLPGHPAGPLAAQVEPLRPEGGDDPRGDLGIGLGAGGIGNEVEAALGREPPKVGRGQDALGRAV